jgi:septation ring formation regulator EzrA
MEGAPPQWPDDGPDGEIMEPDEDEQDPAIERDMEHLEATVENIKFLPELLDKLERDLATKALSLWEGFAAFCEESIGVPAEKVVVVALEPVVDRIEDLKDRAVRLELEPSGETVEEIREGLGENWRTVEERGV